MTALHLSDEPRAREAVVALGRSLFGRGLTAGSSGNISVRLADGGFLMTPTNASLGALEPDRLSRLDRDGRLLSGPKETKEAFLHQAMYAERPGAGAVVHLHATYAAAVSCMAGLDEDDCLPALTPYFVMKIGRLPLLPYHRPGDRALGPLVRRHACSHCAVLLANHGPVVSGTTLETTGYAIEELEETAKLFLLLRDAPTRSLNAEQIADLDETFGLNLPRATTKHRQP